MSLVPKRLFTPLLGTWICTVLSGVGMPSLFYICMRKPAGVGFGLMAEFFWWGGIGGVVLAVLGELITQEYFQGLLPTCNASVRPEDPDLLCQALLLVQWVLTPGFWEELFKAVWVLLRFKSQARWASPDEEACGQRLRTEAVPRRTCFVFPTTCCTFWWRLAKTPEAVFFGAMAAAGGFESIENIEYMFPVLKSLEGDSIAENLFRAVLSVHVLWSGYVGIRLAQRQFKPHHERPSLATAFLPSMIIHGIWDWCAFGNIFPAFLWIPVLYAVSVCMVLIPLKQGALRASLSENVLAAPQVPLEQRVQLA